MEQWHQPVLAGCLAKRYLCGSVEKQNVGITGERLNLLVLLTRQYALLILQSPHSDQWRQRTHTKKSPDQKGRGKEVKRSTTLDEVVVDSSYCRFLIALAEILFPSTLSIHGALRYRVEFQATGLAFLENSGSRGTRKSIGLRLQQLAASL